MVAKMRRVPIHLLAFGVLFFWAAASGRAKAQSGVEEEIRLSQLALSAFECSILASDQKEVQRLFDIGLAAGRRFLEGLNNLTDDEDRKVAANIAVLWNFVAGPSHDFVLGRVYEDRTNDLFKDFEGGDKKLWAIRQEQMFRQRNCALVR